MPDRPIEPSNSVQEPFIERYRAWGLTGGPMDSESIARLEGHLGLPIPSAYRDYLALAGAAPPTSLVGSECHGRHLLDLREWAVGILDESDTPLRLPDDAIVFLVHQGYQFLYFHADGATEDPPVYYFFEGRSEFERSYERFSDWVVAIA